MAAIELLFGESTFIRLVPTTLTEGKISGLGTKIDFPRIVSAKSTPASSGADSSTQYHTTDASNGNRYSRIDKSKNYNIISGEVIVDDGGGDSKPKIECEILVTPAQRKQIWDLYNDGTPVLASRDIGKSPTTDAIAGFDYICGKITDLSDSPERGPSKLSFSIAASDAVEFKTTAEALDVTEADYNAIATGASNTIQPDNEPEVTILALAAGDWSDIVVGKLVQKLVS